MKNTSADTFDGLLAESLHAGLGLISISNFFITDSQANFDINKSLCKEICYGL